MRVKKSVDRYDKELKIPVLENGKGMWSGTLELLVKTKLISTFALYCRRLYELCVDDKLAAG